MVLLFLGFYDLMTSLTRRIVSTQITCVSPPDMGTIALDLAVSQLSTACLLTFLNLYLSIHVQVFQWDARVARKNENHESIHGEKVRLPGWNRDTQHSYPWNIIC